MTVYSWPNDRNARRLGSVGAASVIALAAAALASVAAVPANAQTTAADAAQTQGDIIVTAQRREESASKVPISMQILSQEKMDEQGIRQIGDLSRLTPALYFNQTAGVNGNNGTNIAIRGVASDVGSATTAIYIDETPIQIRSIGYLGGNPYPRVFDLERVEVLRGPQGTLFGAGAEGGAVRFIAAQPRLDKAQVYGRAEISTTDEGAPSYEFGAAVGLPLTANLAIRASGWYRRDGGYIDQVTPQTNNVIAKDVNSQDSSAFKGALLWKPAPNVTLTPSVFYQNVKANAQDQYWAGYGSPAQNDYKTGVYHLEPSRDRFVLPALKIEVDFGGISLVSNSSYFDRKQHQQFSYTTYQSYLRTGNPFGIFANKQPDNSDINLDSSQKNFTQELRLLSNSNWLIDWTAGAFYSSTKQAFQNLTGSGRIPGTLSGGLPQYMGRYSYFEATHANDEQIAVYGNIDLKPTEKVKLSASARYTHNRFDFDDVTDGPTVGNVRDSVVASAKEGAFTPKFTATYQATARNMVYATASKGFRPGGAQPLVSPEFCGADLKALGLTASPRSYSSDSLWNLELGTKNRFLGDRVSLDASVYRLKWKNIQQSINLPTCNLNYIGNLGTATGKGGELSVAVTLFTGMQLGGNFAYTHMAFDDDVLAGNGGLLRAKGQRFGGPMWTGAVFGEYRRDVGRNAQAYARLDYTFARRNTPIAVPGTSDYDRDLPALPGTNFVSVRFGTKFEGVDLSLFVDNLTNSTDLLARNHDGLGGSLYYLQSFRPRTVGLTVQLRR